MGLVSSMTRRIGSTSVPRKHLSASVVASAFVALAWNATGTAHAAGFDCRRASTTIERTICRDPQLSELDGEMARIYQRVQAETRGVNGETGQQVDRIAIEQRYWIRNVRSTCRATDARCLKRVYARRIAQIRRDWADAL